METKELIIPEGWEFKEVIGNKVIISEKEKEFPKTWKECAIIVNEFELFNVDSEVVDFNLYDPGMLLGKEDYRIIPKGLGSPMLSLCQLLICRNAWWKQLGWEPNWKDDFELKHFIDNINGEIDCSAGYKGNKILAFPTPEVRDKFLENFRDLIEQAKELL